MLHFPGLHLNITSCRLSLLDRTDCTPHLAKGGEIKLGWGESVKH